MDAPVDADLERLLALLARPLPYLPAPVGRLLTRWRLALTRVPVVVQLRPGCAPERLIRWVRHRHGRPGPALELADAFAAQLPVAALEELRRDPEVTLVVLDRTGHAL
ncbi:MAG: hypothetical protein M0Z27_02290 [Thermaerobacter sp.]|jgi:hypothetical protein|nr:hypothetical protein [Thermaerobacter sp.]MDA8144879.1 hypothetical protein [Thermaerobacter sp.]